MAEKGFEEALEGLATGPSGVDAETARGGAEGDDASSATVAALRAQFGRVIGLHEIMAGDEHVVHVQSERIVDVLAFLRDDPGQQYDYLADLTAVDWGGGRPIEVVYQLWSIERRRAVRVKAALALDALEIETATGLWSTADWLEREAFDMFGIRFLGHPDHRRILMPDNYEEGFPLRKDFPLRGRFSRAEQTRRALEMTVEEHYSLEELAIADRPSPDSDDESAEAGP